MGDRSSTLVTAGWEGKLFPCVVCTGTVSVKGHPTNWQKWKFQILAWPPLASRDGVCAEASSSASSLAFLVMVPWGHGLYSVCLKAFTLLGCPFGGTFFGTSVICACWCSQILNFCGFKSEMYEAKGKLRELTTMQFLRPAVTGQSAFFFICRGFLGVIQVHNI